MNNDANPQENHENSRKLGPGELHMEPVRWGKNTTPRLCAYDSEEFHSL